MSQGFPTRQHEASIEIPVAVERVWNAITDAKEIRKWFAPEVRVDARVGGEYFVSWGPRLEGQGVIEVFEVQQHLKVITERQAPVASKSATAGTHANAPLHLATDYFLEVARGRTFLRVVQSGFPDTPEWTSEFEQTREDWPIFLRVLRHGLVRHPDAPASQIWLDASAGLTADEAWGRLMGQDGICVKGSVQQLSAGARYTFAGPGGEMIEGRFQIWAPPREFCATWEALNDALISGSFHARPASTRVRLQLSLYGQTPTQIEEVRGSWSSLLNRLFPSSGQAA